MRLVVFYFSSKSHQFAAIPSLPLLFSQQDSHEGQSRIEIRAFWKAGTEPPVRPKCLAECPETVSAIMSE
jgi:hypothetical protein